MTVRVRDASQNPIGKVSARDESNALVVVGAFRVRDAAGLYDVLVSLKASAPASAFGTGRSANTIPVSTKPIAVTVTGAVGDVTHAWSYGDAGWSVYGDASGFIFTANVAPASNEHTIATDTVTDSAGNTAQVSVSLSCTNNSGPIG